MSDSCGHPPAPTSHGRRPMQTRRVRALPAAHAPRAPLLASGVLRGRGRTGVDDRGMDQEQPPPSSSRLELWGGYECTVNRVRDTWYDQTLCSGHESRISDLELFAGLGMRSLRYPALWERMSPDDPAQCDFRWTDVRFTELRRLGVNPIVTLCHHGSGPHYTSLLDDSFAPGLAVHAAAVAQRYPWVRD